MQVGYIYCANKDGALYPPFIIRDPEIKDEASPYLLDYKNTACVLSYVAAEFLHQQLALDTTQSHSIHTHSHVHVDRTTEINTHVLFW